MQVNALGQHVGGDQDAQLIAAFLLIGIKSRLDQVAGQYRVMGDRWFACTPALTAEKKHRARIVLVNLIEQIFTGFLRFRKHNQPT